MSDTALLLRRALTQIEKLQAQLDKGERSNEPIAIIGAGCRFPGGADSPEAFWRALRDGDDGIVEIPEERWPHKGGNETRWAGLLNWDRVSRFDASFFGISPREADSLDPQQRMLLEVSWEALENAAIPPDSLSGSATGVFVGMSGVDYLDLIDPDKLEAYHATGNMSAVAAGRISYTLGLHGPCAVIDTACSSSLVAVHFAAASLKQGECDLVLAAGVNLLLSSITMAGVASTHALSPDGRCYAFDARANGYVRAEGCGVVVLKRLSAALRDGNRVIAVLRGSAVNHDGRSTGLTTPNVLSQRALIEKALDSARVEPQKIGYVETHGTGTSLGDPVEIEGLKGAFGAARHNSAPCFLGSVKANIGHAEAAAGMAGLIKVILALKHETIPRQVNFRTLNPHIRLEGSSFAIPLANVSWPRGGEARVAGVSSFGMSGTNAHLVIEEAPAVAKSGESHKRSAGPDILLISARSEAALNDLAARYVDQPDYAFPDICYTAATGRAHLTHRLALVAESASAADVQFRSQAGWRGIAKAPPRIAFLFSGQGSQYPAMGRGLYDTQPVFRASMDRCAAILDPLLPAPLLKTLFSTDAGAGENLIDRTIFTQPALFALEVSLGELWRSWGVLPVAVMGHSVGEFAAAHFAGIFSLEDGLSLVAARARLMQAEPAGGAMAAVFASEARVRSFADDPDVSIAAVNGPESVVLAGREEALAAACTLLEREGIRTRRLTVSHAFHSALMDPVLDAFERRVATIKLAIPRIPLASNVSGGWAGAEIAGTGYWRLHVRQPVRFAQGMQTLGSFGVNAFVEIGPRPTLLGMGASCVSVREALWLPSLRSGRDEERTIFESLAQLHVGGVAIDWETFHRPWGASRIALPTYPWQRELHWLPAKTQVVPGRSAEGHPLLGLPVEIAGNTRSRIWDHEIDPAAVPWIADHKVEGSAIMPGSAFVEMALNAGREFFGGTAPVRLEALTFLEPLIFPDERPRRVQTWCGVAADGEHASLRISGLQENGVWLLHATASLVKPPPGLAPEAKSIGTIREQFTGRESGQRTYRRLSALGMSYGPAFRGLEESWYGPNQALGRIRLPPDNQTDGWAYGVHPALLDACLHAIFSAVPRDAALELSIPAGMREVRTYAPCPASLWAHASVRLKEGALEADLILLADSGAVLMEFLGVEFRSLRGRHNDHFLAQRWERAPLTTAAKEFVGHGVYCLIGDGSDALRSQLESHGGRVLTGQAALAEPCDAVILWTPDPARVLNVVQTLARGTPNTAPPRLWLITEGAQPVRSSADVTETGLMQAAVWGLGRTIAHEHPEWRVTRVDLAGESAAAMLAAEVLANTDEEELAFRPEGRFIARIVRADPPPAATIAVASGSLPFRLSIDEPGRLDTLRLRPRTLAQPGPGDVVIQVEAAGLNFLDVLTALGVIPWTGIGPISLGAECVGRVVSVGPGVEGLSIGERVVALTPGALGSTVTAPAILVVPAPEGMSAAEVATLPIAHLTAFYGLHHIGRLSSGERVLIHSAAGGVGQAAVQWARHAGCEIFATAGSDTKRAWLAAQGIKWVSDSRSARFVHDVLEWTGGEGVDVVLNSLSGDMIEKSFGLLRDYGRFVELGKRDYLANGSLGLRPFLRNLTFSLVDLGGMIRQRPERLRAILDEVRGHIAKGHLGPLPHETVPVSCVEDAFRRMAQGSHKGKIVLTMNDPHAQIIVPRVSVQSDATYLVTGGLGGLGLGVCRWLVSRGARHLLVLSRRGSSDPEARRHINEMTAAGVHFTVAAVDIADYEAVAATLARELTDKPPLHGVVHAAGILDDGLLINQTAARMEAVMAPKIAGALNLHRLTSGAPLDFFVLYSSVASLLGSPGQGGYAAGNAFLDALAHLRHSQGRPALSINWGPFSGVGLASEAGLEDRMQAQGVRTLTPERGLVIFERLLNSESAQIGVADIDADAAGFSARPWLSGLSTGAVLPKLEIADAGLFVRQQLSQVLRIDPERIALDAEVSTLGLDSLMALEFRQRLESAFGVRLTAAWHWQHPTVNSMVSSLETLRHDGAFVPRGASPVAICRRPNPDATLRLFCLPHLGASVTAFDAWPGALRDFEICAIQMPREEPFVEDFEEAVAHVVRLIGEMADLPYAIFGQSLGGIIAFEAAARLAPSHVILWAPPDGQTMDRLSPDGDPRSVSETLVRMGALPAGLLDDSAVRAVIQADYRLARSYRAGNTMLDGALTILGGTADSLVPPGNLALWRGRTQGAFHIELLDGGHLLPQETPAIVIGAVSKYLGSIANRAKGTPPGRRPDISEGKK